MRAELKREWSADLSDGSLPDDPADCRIGIQAEIGPVAAPGGDTFDFEVCTPAGLEGRAEDEQRAFWARGTLVVPQFSWQEVDRALNQLVRSISGDDWPQIAAKLNRFIRREFEDYRG